MQLLHKLTIRAADSSVKLMSVVKNPVSNHLPVGCKKVLMSFNTQELILPNKLADPKIDEPLVVVIGGIARGKVKFTKGTQFLIILFQITVEYTEQDIKISNYPLSAALCCAKVTSGLEEIWNII